MVETWILYQTTNVCNGMVYVGVHKLANTARSKKYLGSGDRIKAAIKKYGRENFVRETLEEFSSCDDVYAAEAKVVTEDFVKRNDTYNICLGGRGGVNLTEEMKNKLRVANIGRKASPETRIKMSESHKGKIRSAEHSAKLSNSNKGKIRSAEHSAKISAAKKGKNLGRIVSKETKEKIRVANTGKKHTDETKAKLSIANKGIQTFLGKTHNEQSRAKIRAANSGANNWGSVAVIINGVYYSTIKFAAVAENVSPSTAQYRIKNTKPKWSEWRKATDEEKAAYALGGLQ
jgi:group I intron endonuclease